MIWNARFFEISPVFETIGEPARLFASFAAFPTPEEIDEVLRDRAPVRFVRKSQQDKSLYDARIIADGIVPTRAGSWHDLLNALVWATFPLTKTALHRLQHELVVPHAPARTKEQDALAMVDEGGAFLAGGRVAIFGHAIYESFVRGWQHPRAAGIRLPAGSDIDHVAADFLA